MPDKKDQNAKDFHSTAALENMHSLLLEALRHREQEIVHYIAILGPALGGFVWLLYSSKDINVLTIGTLGVLFLLLLGAVYSIALGYNYRYITLQLAKIEAILGITGSMLLGWPKSRQDFLDRYKRLCCIPWCTPPEVIKVFWLAFVITIIGVTVTAFFLIKPKENTSESFPFILIPSLALVCLLISLVSPIWFGFKLRNMVDKEPQKWVE